MKRSEKVTRLIEVGFKPTELLHMSNDALHATYISAQPLMKEKRKEIERVLAITRKQENQRELQSHWNKNWTHPSEIPICTVVSQPVNRVRLLSGLITRTEFDRKRFSRLFRNTGDKQYSAAANKAREERDNYRQSLLAETQH